MKQIKKSALFAVIAGSIASSAFAGFIDVTGTSDFTSIFPGSDTDMYWANLGLFDVPSNFVVDVAPSLGGISVDVGGQSVENSKTFGSLSAGKYHVLMVLADPTNPQQNGTLYSESFNVSSLGRIAGFSYWDGRFGSVDPISNAIALVNGQGGGYTFDPVTPGRGFESHEFDVIPFSQDQDKFSISADLTTINFDLWAFQAQQVGDPFVDMGFIFVAPIPEPSSIVFALTGGVLGLLVYRNAGRRRQS